MPVYYPKHPVTCPVCGTWVEDAELCSWCTVNLRTGSWQQADMKLAVRALRRAAPSIHEFGPTHPDMLLPADSLCGTASGYRAHLRAGEEACDLCLTEWRAVQSVYKKRSRARLAAAKKEAA